VLTELFLPTKGGTAVWAAEVYRRLGGREIHIVTADVPGADEIDAEHPNTVHRLRLERISWLRPESLLMYWRLLYCSLGLALTGRFDSVHAFRALPEGFVAWLVARMTFRTLVIYAHGEELTTWGRGGKYRTMSFVLRHADRVIANSEYTRDQLQSMGVAGNRIVIIHPGVDTNRFRPGLFCDDLKKRIGIGKGGKLIVSVGRLSRRKGFDMLISALPLLVARGIDARYVVIGSGEDELYLSDLAAMKNVRSRVHLLGHVAMDELPRWYNAADVLAMPNRDIDGDTEGFGMVFIEAAACGRPTLAGKAGGTAAAVEDGVTGLRVDGDSVEDIARGLEKILSDEQFAARLGSNGLARVGRDYSWETVALRTRDAIGVSK